MTQARKKSVGMLEGTEDVSEGTGNGGIFVQISEVNFNRENNEVLPFDVGSDTEEDEIDVYDEDRWCIDSLEGKTFTPPQSGHKPITKHNLAASKRKNGYKLYASSLAFRKCKPKKETKKPNLEQETVTYYYNKPFTKTQQIFNQSYIDNFSRSTIDEMIFNRQLEKLNCFIGGPRHPGCCYDEIRLFHADYILRKNKLPQECLIKVFSYDNSKRYFWTNYNRTEALKLCQQFGRRDSMMKREVSSLKKLHRTSVHCPRILAHKNNVVVMTFIGQGQKSAPKITKVFLTEDYNKIYLEVVEAMIVMFTKNIIHGDLMENILWHDGHCYIVNFCDSLNSNDENAFEGLYRDCSAVANFFKGRIDGVATAEELFETITGRKYTD